MDEFFDFIETCLECMRCPYSELGLEACLFCPVYMEFDKGGD